uniref:DNA polymerase n=1 Tax=Kalanchoe fedtschenkoi TaxID=63787 RepID=A0A7N0TAE2_KALFE
MPKLTKGNSMFGAGASPGIMSCIAGRLLCDTFLCSRDLLKEVSYSLTQLAKNQLHKDRKEIAPQDIPSMFQKLESLIELIECAQQDAWLSLELMFHLSVIPLTHQLTKLSGNLWGKTLQGARAQRVEYLLLHAFHEQKYINPDKTSAHANEAKDQRLPKRRIDAGSADRNAEEFGGDDAKLETDHVKGKKGPAYAGGLVLEPKRGLYDKYILLLDFNSLYPSIIQEYNICFTTVEKTTDGSIPHLPSFKEIGVLPKLLRDLVERRKRVKQMMKNAPRIKLQQHDIHQQALKLTANSMYGCLGFSNSRFYAKPLAELITLQGREILQRTVDLVQNNLNLEVIYGDTDSIMIHTGLDDIEKAKSIAVKVTQEVNKKYQCLVIDLDGLYKRMLLLKKKKYAAIKVQFRNDIPYEVIERKGLDMVRRDWSLISKEIGDFCLNQILSGGSCDDVVESIHGALVKVREEMKNGEIQLEKYVITKTLTKQPEAYPDGKNQPHVQVALRMKQNGSCTGFSPGDTIPYVICCEQGTSSAGSSGMAQRARHPDELKDNGKWIIDIDYYLSQQIHPVVSRLCASIQGTSPERLADCLGLDSTKFQRRPNYAADVDHSSLLLGSVDDCERYEGCEPLVISCPSCSSSFDCPVVVTSFCGSTDDETVSPAREKPERNFWQSLRCPRCPIDGDMGRVSPAMIANQVKRQADHFLSLYYRNTMTCDDETCNYTTRGLNLRASGDFERGSVCPNYPHCNGHLLKKYTEADLYKQLSYFCHVLDTEKCLQKLNMEASARMSLETSLSRIRPVVQMAASVVSKMRDRCAFGWINLSDLVVAV